MSTFQTSAKRQEQHSDLTMIEDGVQPPCKKRRQNGISRNILESLPLQTSPQENIAEILRLGQVNVHPQIFYPPIHSLSYYANGMHNDLAVQASLIKMQAYKNLLACTASNRPPTQMAGPQIAREAQQPAALGSLAGYKQGQAHRLFLSHTNNGIASSRCFQTIPALPSDKAAITSSTLHGIQEFSATGMSTRYKEVESPMVRRLPIPLAVDEDHNWLSQFQCFVRSELVEVFRASQQDVEDRKTSKVVIVQQVGMRCKMCAHLPSSERAGRSSAFPSSIRQIYQSFTMMVRDHFVLCSAIPASMKHTFLTLKKKASQGDANSNEYWKYSAAKLGMVDSENVILLDENTQAAALKMPHFGASPNYALSSSQKVPLVSEEDRGRISAFLYSLMSQCQWVNLLPSECKGNRKSLKPGQLGVGCRYCCEAGRFGFCRIFPLKRNKMPAQMYGFFEHIRRCSLCPFEVKVFLASLDQQISPLSNTHPVGEKDYFDRIWANINNSFGDH